MEFDEFDTWGEVADAGPMDLIWFEDSEQERVKEYLITEPAASYLPALEATESVIDGFESPLGMELLATVDWLLLRGECEPSVRAIRSALAEWPGGKTAGKRKLKLFDDRLIQLALDRLTAWYATNPQGATTA